MQTELKMKDDECEWIKVMKGNKTNEPNNKNIYLNGKLNGYFILVKELH